MPYPIGSIDVGGSKHYKTYEARARREDCEQAIEQIPVPIAYGTCGAH